MDKIKAIPTTNNVGCYISLDLRKVSREQFQEIKSLLDKYGVLFFKEQQLSPEQYIDFTSKFGKPAEYPMLKPHFKFKNIYVIERKKTDIGKSFGEGYHTDSQYLENPPRYTFLQAINGIAKSAQKHSFSPIFCILLPIDSLKVITNITIF